MIVKQTKKNKSNSKSRTLWQEFRDEILFELIWNVLLYLPRLILRILKNIF